MNKLSDKKELEKKNGQEAVEDEKPSTDGGSRREQTMGAGLPQKRYSSAETETAVLRRPERVDVAGGRFENGRRPNGAVPSAPDIFEMFARKGDAEENAKRERIVNKNRNATEFFNLVGWLSKGNPSTPIPFGVGRGKRQDALPSGLVKPVAREEPEQGASGAGKLPVNNKKHSATKKSGEFWDGYSGDLLERVGAGVVDLNGALYGAADIVDRITVRPFLDLIDPTIRRPFREWADGNYALADDLRRKSDRYKGRTLGEQWKNGDYWDIVGSLGLGLGEALPDAVVAAGTGGVAPAVLGATAAVKKYDNLNRMPETRDMPELQKATNAVTTGAMEALTDKLGGKAMGKEFRNVYKNMERSAVKSDVSKQVSNRIRDMYRKFGILPESVGEGVEEMANQIAENIADYTTGATDEWAPMKGVPESLANGISQGVVFKRLPGMVEKGMDYRSRKRANGNAKPDGLNKADGRDSQADPVPGTDGNGRLLLQQPSRQTDEVILGDGRKLTVNTSGRDVDGMPTDGASADRIYEKMEKIKRGEMDGEVTLEEPGRMLYGDRAVTVDLDRLRGDGKVEVRDENGNSSLADVKDLKPLPVVETMPDGGPRKATSVPGDFIEYQGRKINRDDAADFLVKTQLEIDRLSKSHMKDALIKQMISARIRERKQMMKEIDDLLNSSGMRKNEGGTQPGKE